MRGGSPAGDSDVLMIVRDIIECGYGSEATLSERRLLAGNRQSQQAGFGQKRTFQGVYGAEMIQFCSSWGDWAWHGSRI